MAEKTDTPGATPESAAGTATGTAPGDQKQDPNRTPGDGTLTGATPAGLTSEELRRRAKDPNTSSDGGTG